MYLFQRDRQNDQKTYKKPTKAQEQISDSAYSEHEKR